MGGRYEKCVCVCVWGGGGGSIHLTLSLGPRLTPVSIAIKLHFNDATGNLYVGCSQDRPGRHFI